MAFNTAKNASSSADNAGRNDSWKAHGFVNMYLPSRTGGRRKLGALPLRKANANEKQLADWLAADAAHVQTLRDKLIIEFNPAESVETAGFAFVDAAPAAEAQETAGKAAGYLNFYLPTTDGNRRRVGAIALHKNNLHEMQLCAWLTEDASRVATIYSQLVVQYQSAEPATGAAFALG